MRIQLNNAEILDALFHYVGTLGINVSGKKLSIEFVQGRKNGLSADISIDESTVEAVDENEVIIEETEEPKPEREPESIDGAQSIFS